MTLPCSCLDEYGPTRMIRTQTLEVRPPLPRRPQRTVRPGQTTRWRPCNLVDLPRTHRRANLRSLRADLEAWYDTLRRPPNGRREEQRDRQGPDRAGGFRRLRQALRRRRGVLPRSVAVPKTAPDLYPASDPVSPLTPSVNLFLELYKSNDGFASRGHSFSLSHDARNVRHSSVQRRRERFNLFFSGIALSN